MWFETIRSIIEAHMNTSMNLESTHFNIRVYGILINAQDEVLLSRESYKGKIFTKFPGGGVCLGEGVEAALHREFKEEGNIRIAIKSLLHITGDYVPSAFDDSQVVGVYYLVEAMEELDLGFREQIEEAGKTQAYHWVSLKEMHTDRLGFEMDRAAWKSFINLRTAHK